VETCTESEMPPNCEGPTPSTPAASAPAASTPVASAPAASTPGASAPAPSAPAASTGAVPPAYTTPGTPASVATTIYATVTPSSYVTTPCSTCAPTTLSTDVSCTVTSVYTIGAATCGVSGMPECASPPFPTEGTNTPPAYVTASGAPPSSPGATETPAVPSYGSTLPAGSTAAPVGSSVPAPSYGANTPATTMTAIVGNGGSYGTPAFTMCSNPPCAIVGTAAGTVPAVGDTVPTSAGGAYGNSQPTAPAYQNTGSTLKAHGVGVIVGAVVGVLLL
jgi:hypothetical protein